MNRLPPSFQMCEDVPARGKLSKLADYAPIHTVVVTLSGERKRAAERSPAPSDAASEGVGTPTDGGTLAHIPAERPHVAKRYRVEPHVASVSMEWAALIVALPGPQSAMLLVLYALVALAQALHRAVAEGRAQTGRRRESVGDRVLRTLKNPPGGRLLDLSLYKKESRTDQWDEELWHINRCMRDVSFIDEVSGNAAMRAAAGARARRRRERRAAVGATQRGVVEVGSSPYAPLAGEWGEEGVVQLCAKGARDAHSRAVVTAAVG
jgi:hypothetical protein